jgi:oligosaccharide repeat unit polymerase
MTQSNLASFAGLPRYLILAEQYPIYPILGLVSTVVGTVLALAFIPRNPFPAGELASSATAMALGLAAAPIAASFRNLRTMLRAEHLLVIAPIYWLLMDLIQGTYDLVDVDKASIEAAFLAIGLFVCGLWFAALLPPHFSPKALAKSASRRLSGKLLFRIILIFFILGIFKYAYPCNFDPALMLDGLMAERNSAPWARGSQATGIGAVLDHLGYFGYLLPTLTVLLWTRSRRLNPPVIIAIALSLMMAAFLAQLGGRRIIGVIFGAALICWIIEQEKLKIQHLLLVVVTSVVLLTGMQYMLEVRSVGVKDFLQQGAELRQTNLRVDDNFLRLSQIISIVPKQHPYVYEKQVIFALIRPIPRAMWPTKPLNPGFDLTVALGDQGMEGTSLTSSVIGEWYYSFGWVGVFIGGLIYGRLAGLASLLLVKDAESAGAIVYSLLAMTLFVGMRSMLELVLTSYAVLAWMGISWLLLRKQRLPHNNIQY